MPRPSGRGGSLKKSKLSDTIEAEKEETSDGTLKARPDLGSMLNSTLAKAKKYGGDPFYEYRRAGILPEKYEYGMNCLFDSMCQIIGVFSVQKIYEELRKDVKKYKIQQDTPMTNLPGIPVLFGLSAKAFANAQDAAINRVKREFIENFFIDLSLFMEALNESNKKDTIVLCRTVFKQFSEHSDKLVNNAVVFYKSKDKEYYDFLIFQGIKNGYADDVNGRQVEFSASSIDDIIVLILKAQREKYFTDAKNLSEKEASSISVVYEYHEGKPAYREGKKLYILEDGYNIRVIENAEEEFKRTKVVQARKQIADTIKTTDHDIQTLENCVRDAKLFLEETSERISTNFLQRLTEVVDIQEDILNSLNGTLSRLKETADNLEKSNNTLREEALTGTADASDTLEIEKGRTQLRDMEVRLRNTSQEMAFMRKRITSLGEP